MVPTEIARNHFMERGMFRVIGGIISPVHDDQHKQGLVGGEHRLAMLKLALRSSNWIRVICIHTCIHIYKALATNVAESECSLNSS